MNKPNIDPIIHESKLLISHNQNYVGTIYLHQSQNYVNFGCGSMDGRYVA